MPSPTSGTPAEYADFNGDTSIDALLGGTRWANSTLSFSFPSADGGPSSWSTDPAGGYGPQTGDGEPWSASFAGLGAEDQQAVRDALAAWSSVAQLQFVESVDSADTVGDLRFAYTSGGGIGGSQAQAYFPADGPSAGDVWFNADGTSYTALWTPGSFEYMTVLHEIGHALGLKHPFEAMAGALETLPASLDSRSYTVMSYAAVGGDQATNFSFEPTTPMMLDIRALQWLYGASNTAPGNTQYLFSGASSYHQTIWDAGGVDTFVYQSSTGGEIDLNAGVGGGSQLGLPVMVIDGFGQEVGSVYNVWIAYGAVIENATGGAGDDTLIGNDVANVLRGEAGGDAIVGGAGNDTLRGGVGNDSLDGGDGVDTATYFGESAAVSVALSSAALQFTGAATGSDRLLSIEGLIGSAFADSLAGNTLANRLDGSLGADSLAGSLGNDVYVIDDTGDRVTEVAAGGLDTVLASVSFVLPSDVEQLTLLGSAVRNGTGNAAANLLTGNGAANVLSAGAGNDTLNGGAGNDTLNGGQGADLLAGGDGHDVYVLDSALDRISETGTLASTDDQVLSGVSFTLGAGLERLTLTGTASIGGTGNALANTITGNAGNNLLSGGAGVDTLSYANAVRGVAVNLALTGAQVTGFGSDTVSGFEHLAGSAFADRLIGNAGNNRLAGGAGSDTLSGGAGADLFVLDHRSGADTFTDFVSGSDDVRVGMAAIRVGDGDLLVEGATTRAAKGGFAASAELVVFTANLATLSTSAVAAAIGSASSGYTLGRTALFALDTGARSALFLFTAANTDALVSAGELTLLASLTGTPATAVGDYLFGA